MKKLTIKSSSLTEQITPFGGATVWSIQLFDENENVVTVQTGSKKETIQAASELAASVNSLNNFIDGSKTYSKKAEVNV